MSGEKRNTFNVRVNNGGSISSMSVSSTGHLERQVEYWPDNSVVVRCSNNHQQPLVEMRIIPSAGTTVSSWIYRYSASPSSPSTGSSSSSTWSSSSSTGSSSSSTGYSSPSTWSSFSSTSSPSTGSSSPSQGPSSFSGSPQMTFGQNTPPATPSPLHFL